MTHFSRFSAESDRSTSASRASDSGEDYDDSSYSLHDSSQTRKDEAVQVYKGSIDMLQEQIQVPRTPRPRDIDVCICLQRGAQIEDARRNTADVTEQAADQQVGAAQKWPPIFENQKEEAETEREFKTDTALQPRAAAPVGSFLALHSDSKAHEQVLEEHFTISLLVGLEELEIALKCAHSHSKALTEQCTQKAERERELKELKDKIQMYIKELLCQRQQQHVEMQRQRLDHEEALEERHHDMRKQLTERGEDIEKLRKEVDGKNAVILAQATDCQCLRELLRLEAEGRGGVECEREWARETQVSLQAMRESAREQPRSSALLQSARGSAREQTAARERRVRALEEELAAVQAERETLQGAKEALVQQVAQLEDAARATDEAASQQQLQELQQEMRSMRQETAKQQADLQEQNACLAACAQAEERRAEHLSKQLHEAATKCKEDTLQRTQGQPSYHRLCASIGSLNRAFVDPHRALICRGCEVRGALFRECSIRVYKGSLRGPNSRDAKAVCRRPHATKM